jgi:hypothetical protein
MSRATTPTPANRQAAREMLPAQADRLVRTSAEALKPLAAVAATSGEASPALVLDALVALRNAEAEIAQARQQLQGVLVLAGVARSTLARATGQRPESLVARLLNTPASWCGRDLVRDSDAVGGWRA